MRTFFVAGLPEIATASYQMGELTKRYAVHWRCIFFRTMTSLLDEHPAATHSMWGSFCVRQACSCGGSALRGGGLRRHVLLWYDFSSGCA
jgi:hypothetical protein